MPRSLEQFVKQLRTSLKNDASLRKAWESVSFAENDPGVVQEIILYTFMEVYENGKPEQLNKRRREMTVREIIESGGMVATYVGAIRVAKVPAGGFEITMPDGSQTRAKTASQVMELVNHLTGGGK